MPSKINSDGSDSTQQMHPLFAQDPEQKENDSIYKNNGTIASSILLGRRVRRGDSSQGQTVAEFVPSVPAIVRQN